MRRWQCRTGSSPAFGEGGGGTRWLPCQCAAVSPWIRPLPVGRRRRWFESLPPQMIVPGHPNRSSHALPRRSGHGGFAPQLCNQRVAGTNTPGFRLAPRFTNVPLHWREAATPGTQSAPAGGPSKPTRDTSSPRECSWRSYFRCWGLGAREFKIMNYEFEALVESHNSQFRIHNSPAPSTQSLAPGT